MMAISISSTAIKIGEIQREYLFSVKFTHLPGFGTTGGNSDLSELYNSWSLWLDGKNDTGLLDCFCVGAKFPDRKQARIKFAFGGEYLYYAGVDNTEKAIPFRFLLSENNEIFGMLNALKDLTGDLFNNRARPKAVLPDAYTGSKDYDYGPDELALAISMVSVNKTYGSKNMYRELRNCSVYSVEGINADKGSQQSAPTLVTCEIGYDFIGRIVLDTTNSGTAANYGIGHNFRANWNTGDVIDIGNAV
jgi:hypothetical protein